MNKYRNSIITALIILVSVVSFAQTKSKPLIIGESETLYSKHLKEERVLNIYLPIGYNANDTVKYPVIYILDGGMDEDFQHIASVVSFQSQSWVAKTPQAIVVGIEGNQRRRDFTFAVSNTDFIEKEGFQKAHFPAYGGSDNYIKFIQNEVQPYINKQYLTNGVNTVIGESLAGLFTTELFAKAPQLFTNYVIISPSLWWGEKQLLKDMPKLLRTNLNKPVQVYLGVPSREEDIKMYDESIELKQLLEQQPNIRLHFDYLPNETHATIIHQAVYNALPKLNNK